MNDFLAFVVFDGWCMKEPHHVCSLILIMVIPGREGRKWSACSLPGPLWEGSGSWFVIGRSLHGRWFWKLSASERRRAGPQSCL